ncbi:MAG: N-acetylneuraminate synthase [Gammaproteobacteria bacterium]|nr:MAG: N-acetylneuraminate synthase [Gammaproteobacteria bacterium]
MTVIIAEVGVNHNGSEKLAFELVDAAYDAGADVVKFQTFKTENMVTVSAQQAEYQIENTGQKESQLAMLKRLELSKDTYHKLTDYCSKIGIEFLSTPFDSESLDFLVNQLGIKTLKLPSGEITNFPLALEYARTGCNMIVSTGMSTLAEVEGVLGVIAFGYTADSNQKPGVKAFQNALMSEKGREALQNKVTLLHCTTEYPAPVNEINLLAMDTLKREFHLPVGYSDHSSGIVIPIAAVARGAAVIEKHLTLDRNMEGPDHKASIEPNELKDMVKAIRDIEVALGNGVKEPSESEIKNKGVARKSLVAKQQIKAGDRFDTENLGVKRPGNGISPAKYWSVLGGTAKRNYEKDEVIID